MLKISIPTPCHEDWNAMMPNAQGRHCNACVKTVVDFTNMSDAEVKYFFLNRKEEKVCGRFKTEQLHRITIELPENIFYLRLPFWKKFLAACLLAFSATLFSCDTTIMGKSVKTTHDSTTFTTTEFNIGKPVAPLPPPPACTIVGALKLLPFVKDSSFVTGTLIAEPSVTSEPLPAEILKEEPLLDSAYMKLQADSTKIKNPSKADSSNCDTKIFN